ncbi:MAG: universal stress protein [Chromatiales bacterium]|nr:universal stress protein [Chromatiales bacterium]
MRCKILLPVDGSEGSARAARHVARHRHHGARTWRCTWSMSSPRGDDWMVRRMIKPEELAKMEQEWGEAAIAPARSILKAAGVACVDHMVQGEVAPDHCAAGRGAGLRPDRDGYAAATRRWAICCSARWRSRCCTSPRCRSRWSNSAITQRDTP